MFLSTTQEIAGKRIIENKNLVFGEAVITMGLGTIWSDVSISNDTNRTSYELKLADAKKRATDIIIYNAKQVGANAIVGISVNIEFGGNRSLFISACGTAVIVE